MWGSELAIIRRYLRDPRGNIWSEALLRALWTEVQLDFQLRTNLLEDIAAIPVPPAFGSSYMHDWERAHVPATPAHRCLRNQGSNFTYTSRFEVLEHNVQEADVSDVGDTFTHPFESWYGSAGLIPRFPLPADFGRARAVYYDLRPLPYGEARNISEDWETREGEPVCYFREDAVSNTMTIYPRPSTIVWNDVVGDGMVTSVADDTTGDEEGILLERTLTGATGDTGVTISVLEGDDNVLMFYQRMPRDENGSDIGVPQYLAKYIRYGVLHRAFLANTDGNIPSLANYWAQRYQAGLKVAERFKSKRRSKRVAGLMPSRRPTLKRYPQLPDTYPAI